MPEGVAGRRNPVTAVDLRRDLSRLEAGTRTHQGDAYDRAGELLEAAEALGRPDLALRAQLVQADVLCRRGQLAAGGRLARAALRWGQEHGDRYLQARSHLVLDLFFAGLADNARALEHALQAVQLLDDEDATPEVRLDHQLRLAGAIAMSGDRAGARDRYVRVVADAEELGHTELLWVGLNNMAWNEYEADEPELALALIERVRDMAGLALATLHPGMVDTLARALMRLGRYREAESALESLAPHAATEGLDANGRAQCLLALAQCRRRDGRLPAAQDALDACVALCGQAGLAVTRTAAHAEQAEVHAAAGAYEPALHEFRTFHEQTIAALSREKEARAQTLQAVFEAQEARQESRRYRELSLRDPLTSLYNRRYMDQVLPVALRRCFDQGRPLTLGLLDLDHFKQINDVCSHEAGDAVLQAVAGLLVEALPPASQPVDGPAGFTARIGGEEFVLVLPGVAAAEAGGVLADVRRRIAEHPWSALTGSVPVTASIGGTVVVPGDPLLTPADVLSRADKQLYFAKSAGRDRVRLDGEAPVPATGPPAQRRLRSP